METERPAARISTAHLRVHQARGEISVLAAPASESLVVTVDAHEVIAPDTEIAAANSPQVGPKALQREWPVEGVGPTFQLAGSQRQEPVGGEIAFPKLFGGILLEQRPV